MADRQNFGAKIENAVPASWPHSLAHRVAAAVVDDIEDKIHDDLFASLKAAVLDPDPKVCRAAIRQSLADGTRPEDLADFYIPAIARDLGDLWCVDQLGFASVTIGVSRLQAMMRELDPNWSSNKSVAAVEASILLVVLQDVYHTLGAIVLSSQLRRKGYSVKLLLGGKAQDVAKRIINTKYDCVFMSCSSGESLESVRRVVDAVKSTTNNPPPVVVGGSILEVETVTDITTLTGADYATRIPAEALRFCGLQQFKQHSAQAKNGT